MDLLTNPFLIVGLLLGLAVLLVVIVRPKAALLGLSVLVFLGGLGGVSQEDFRFDALARTWLFTVQSQRTNLYLLVGGMMALATLFHAGRISIRSIHSPGVALLILGVFVGLVTIVHEGPTDGIFTVIAAIAITGSLTLMLPALLEEYEDWLWMLRAMLLAGLVWMGAVIIQMGINPSALTLGNQFRFIGLTGNPQHAAAFLGVMNVVAAFLCINEPRKRFRLLWIAMLGLGLVLQAWTGSRTGALMFVIGLTAIFYSRVGRAIFVLPLVGVFIVLGVNLVQSLGLNIGADRLISTEDTRSMAWLALLQTALENPLTGVGTRFAGASENSYLLAFAAFGLGAFLLTLVLLVVGVIFCIRLVRARFVVAPHFARLTDLTIGFFIMFFVGAMLEGYLVSRVSMMIPMFLAFSAMGARILVGARHQIEHPAHAYGDLEQPVAAHQ